MFSGVLGVCVLVFFTLGFGSTVCFWLPVPMVKHFGKQPRQPAEMAHRTQVSTKFVVGHDTIPDIHHPAISYGWHDLACAWSTHPSSA